MLYKLANVLRSLNIISRFVALLIDQHVSAFACSSNYNKARLSYNLRTQAYPAFMVYVKTVNQVGFRASYFINVLVLIRYVSKLEMCTFETSTQNKWTDCDA